MYDCTMGSAACRNEGHWPPPQILEKINEFLKNLQYIFNNFDALAPPPQF